MKKLVSVLLCALLLLCSITAAGTKESAVSSGNGTTLRVSWWGGDSRHTPTLAAFDLYGKKNPDVKVSGEYSGWDGYYQKIVTQIAGGTAADIIQIDQPWINDLCSKGDVFATINPDKIDLSQFDAEFLKNYCSYDGKLVGLPTGTNVNTLIMDAELLKASGIDPNTVWTWENMISEGKKVHAANKDNYFLCAPPDHMRFWFEVYMAQIAGAVVDNNKKVAFSEDQGTQAFEYFQKWFDEGIVAPFAETSLFYQKFNESPAWINGQRAAAWCWVSSMERDIGKRKMETRQLPVMKGAKNSGVLMRPSQIFVVNNNSKDKDKAESLLSFLFFDSDAIKTLGTCRGIPSTTSGRKILSENNQISAMTENATNEGIAQSGLPQSKWQMSSEIMQTMQDVIDEFGYGKLTPREASKKMIASLNTTLASLE